MLWRGWRPSVVLLQRYLWFRIQYSIVSNARFGRNSLHSLPRPTPPDSRLPLYAPNNLDLSQHPTAIC